MTSLAVRLETSSTSQRREDRRVRERKQERNRGGGKTRKKKKIRQAANAFAVSKRTLKKGESDAKKPCISVCTESLPNDSSVTCYDPVAVILTDIHGS